LLQRNSLRNSTTEEYNMSLLDKAVDKLTIDAVAEFAEHMLA
jgi:hypothetical protein